MNTISTDRIEKQIVVHAPRARVWRALTDTKEFGQWFGVALTGTFEPGARIEGAITHKGYEHLKWKVVVEKMEPERLFSFHWHPYAIDPKVDYSAEEPTLVVFELAEAADGTRVTVTESGFDRVPLARRAEAFKMNDQGWAAQMESIKRHVAKAS